MDVDTRDRAVAVAAALAERGVQARVEQVRRAPVRDEAAPEGGGGAEPPADGPAGGHELVAEPVDEPVADEPAHDLVGEPADDLAGEPVDEVVDDEPDGFAPVVIGSGRSAPTGVEPDPAPEPAAEPAPPAADVPPPADAEPEFTESWQVTTPFRADLAGLAAQWFDGDRKVVPPDFTLDGGALRLWALASGRWVESGSGYLLGLDPAAPDTHETLRKALAGSGLPATLLADGAGGPALRVVGRRRLERLAELVGRAPRGVAERTWPAA
ncbi:hypothetical protein ACFXGA_00135 [Actinosynnema sp. NPDC059335]|uniref:hypothetical protein n=1 Tax=Actinosynnema sp. NPDC059335 TaxID=3346804 RepID=UPI00366FD187